MDRLCRPLLVLSFVWVAGCNDLLSFVAAPGDVTGATIAGGDLRPLAEVDAVDARRMYAAFRQSEARPTSRRPGKPATPSRSRSGAGGRSRRTSTTTFGLGPLWISRTTGTGIFPQRPVRSS